MSFLRQARWQRSTNAGPLKVRNRVSARSYKPGPSFNPKAQPSSITSKLGGGPSIIVILSSIKLPDP